MTTHPTSLELETIHSLLSNPVRTTLLRHLSVAGRVTTADAAARIATWDDTGSADSPWEEQTTVFVQLVHNHLPRLDNHDVVAYDRSSEHVARGQNFDDVEPYVSPADPSIDARLEGRNRSTGQE